MFKSSGSAAHVAGPPLLDALEGADLFSNALACFFATSPDRSCRGTQ